jgi:hypothetical protein
VFTASASVSIIHHTYSLNLMKTKTLLLTGLCALFSYTASFAQSTGNRDMDTDVTKGRFAYALNEREQVQVSYRLAPLNPSTTAHFMIHTPEAMPFRTTVTNSKNKVVYTWTPQSMVYMQEADWDLSALKAGDYTVNIFLGTDNTRVHYFSFRKN